VDQPYKYVGTWVVDQWNKIGVHATQKVVPTGPWFAAQRSGDFNVNIGANCHSIVNPVIDGLLGAIRLFRRPEGGRSLRQGAA
jgi:peptide/nickel transport system substrate-binding protein